MQIVAERYHLSTSSEPINHAVLKNISPSDIYKRTATE
jgi:hypothetical protein